jgi:hypothetical protein
MVILLASKGLTNSHQQFVLTLYVT